MLWVVFVVASLRLGRSVVSSVSEGEFMDEQVTLGSPERFGYEWSKWNAWNPSYEEQFMGWITPLQPNDISGRFVIDAGCGMGRNSAMLAKCGARRILAFDVQPSTVRVAQQNLASLNNVEVNCQSIYDAVVEDGAKADIAFSIGVIHHLAQPLTALRRLVDLTRSGGTVHIWVYGYEGNAWLVRALDPIRVVTSRLPMPLVSLLSWIPTLLLVLYLKFPGPRSPYLSLLRSFTVSHIRSIVLDQLLPRIANYWRQDEVVALMEAAGLVDVRVTNVRGMSWSALGVVPETRAP